MPELTLGDRIGQIRRRRSMTQEELAERAGISADVVRKLEQNRRSSSTTRTLHAIARALEIETSELLRDGAELDNTDHGDGELLLSLRRTLMPAPGATTNSEPPGADWLAASLRNATQELKGARYRGALAQLSELLYRAGTSTPEDPETARILSTAHLLTGRTLIQLRHEDLAYGAVERAMQLAAGIDDTVSMASAADALIWILIRQARFADAETSALHFAAMVEQSITSKDKASMAVFGQLCLRASASAARNNRPDRADEHLSVARAAAARLGTTVESLIPYRTAFGPSRVAALEVESAMVVGDAGRALVLARNIPVATGRSARRHLLTIAEAQAAMHQYTPAARTLAAIRETAPEWLVAQRLAGHIVRELLDSRGVRWARNSGVADLASAMKIAV